MTSLYDAPLLASPSVIIAECNIFCWGCDVNHAWRYVKSLSEKGMQTSKNSQLHNSGLFFFPGVAVCFKASHANGEAQVSAKSTLKCNDTHPVSALMCCVRRLPCLRSFPIYKKSHTRSVSIFSCYRFATFVADSEADMFPRWPPTVRTVRTASSS